MISGINVYKHDAHETISFKNKSARNDFPLNRNTQPKNILLIWPYINRFVLCDGQLITMNEKHAFINKLVKENELF